MHQLYIYLSEIAVKRGYFQQQKERLLSSFSAAGFDPQTVGLPGRFCEVFAG